MPASERPLTKARAAVQIGMEFFQRRAQFVRHHHRVGGARQIQQGAVYVKKKGRIAVHGRRHREWSKSCVSMRTAARAKGPALPDNAIGEAEVP